MGVRKNNKNKSECEKVSSIPECDENLKVNKNFDSISQLS